MDKFRASGIFSSTELHNLNLVRMHLQVATLSDITSADGRYIDSKAFGALQLDSRVSPLLWPRQPSITFHQQKLWTKALRSLFTLSPYGVGNNKNARRLTQPLSHWLTRPNQHGTDGGLTDTSGSFGVVIALGNQDLWECAGPVDGNPSTVNSKRPELAGYAASLEVLLMLHVLSKDIYTEGTLKVTTWIDSFSAGKHLEKLLCGQLTKRHFPPDLDLLAHINWLWKELPHIKHSVKWVKTHQDNTLPVAQLPLSAKLNVKADKLATQYYQAMMNKEVTWISHTNPSPFPSCLVTLRVNGQVITAQSKATLRFHINGMCLRKHLQESQKGWNDQVWASIDLSGLGGAFLSMPVTHRLKLSKLLHGWLNTGHQHKKWSRWLLASVRSATRKARAMQQHILQCSGSSMKVARFNAIIKLRFHTVTKHGSSITWTTLILPYQLGCINNPRHPYQCTIF